MAVLISEVWLELGKFLGSRVYTGRQCCTVRTEFHVVENTLLYACGASLEEFKGLLDIVFSSREEPRSCRLQEYFLVCLSQVSLPDLPSRLNPVEHMGWSVQDGGTRIQDQLRSLTSFLVEG